MLRALIAFCVLPLLLDAQPGPMQLPGNFDPEANMTFWVVEGRKFHPIPQSANLASRLVAHGHPDDLALAEKVVDGVLSAQERRPGDPHLGNFWWTVEEGVVEDLNAVQFALFYMIPMVIEHGDWLSPALRERMLEAIDLGLEEIRRIDVNVAYTNIALKDITNSCLGGELLGDKEIASRGYRKLQEWMAFTDRNGSSYEYNSNPYISVAVRVLSKLAQLSQDDETRIRAEVMLARLGLTIALHMNPGTSRWAGPHGRAYHGMVYGGGRPEMESFRGWIRDGVLPGWLADAVDERSAPAQVVETTDAACGIATSTYHSGSFSLGVATRELSNQANRYIRWQSNLFSLQYRRGTGRPAGSMFTRYILDEMWLGDFGSTPARPPTALIPERGLFHGVHDRDRAIAIYAPENLNALETHYSAKLAIAWPRWDDSGEICIADRQVKRLPAPVPRDATVTIAHGDALIAIRPLTLTDLGRDARFRIRVIGDALVLELYNYYGPHKTFWELGNPGTFFQGMPQCGFYAEVAERSAYPTPAALAKKVAAGRLEDRSAPPFTWDGKRPRPWRVEYERDGRALGIEIDLMDFAKPARRWFGDEDANLPMLESPVARQNRTGRVQVGDATLTCGQSPAWLFASPKNDRYTAAYHGPEASRVTLELPGGKVEVPSMSTGLIKWDNGEVTVDAIGHKPGAEIVRGAQR